MSDIDFAGNAEKQMAMPEKGETIALKGFTAEDGTNFDSKIKLVPTEDPANPYKVDFVKTEKKTKKKSE